MLKTMIVSGGEINKEFLKSINKKYKFDKIIACDRGLDTLDACNINPNYIIGDFDSLNKDILEKYENSANIKIVRLNPEKDYTDTHMALKLAIELESKEIIILGGIGSRLDHTIANINILKEALDNDVTCKIVNEHNIITLIKNNIILKKDKEYKYVSLIPLTSSVTGITLNGFKYPLIDATMKIGESIGVSNEQIEKIATIEIKEGILILLKTKD